MAGTRIRFRLPHWRAATRFRDTLELPEPRPFGRSPTRGDMAQAASRQSEMLASVAHSFGMTYAEADQCMRDGVYIICRPKQFGLYMAERLDVEKSISRVTLQAMEVTIIPERPSPATELDVSDRTP